jgi:hypothetical protein
LAAAAIVGDEGRYRTNGSYELPGLAQNTLAA